MRDPRLAKLAASLLDYSLEIKPGEKLLIESEAAGRDLVIELIDAAYERQVIPFVQMGDARVRRAWYLNAKRDQMDLEVGWALHRLADIDASVYIIGGANATEMADVPPSVLETSRLASEQLLDEHLRKKWFLLRFPTPSADWPPGPETPPGNRA
jgi:aminopeptidase